MTAVLEKMMTIEETVLLEQRTGIRYELVDGVLHAMAGETRRHKKLAAQLYRLLFEAATTKQCEWLLEAKIRTVGARYRYPDLVLSCHPGDDPYYLENPCLIIEVLSESTAATDSTEKLEEYLKIPTLRQYVLVEQQVERLIVYSKVHQTWQVQILEQGQLEILCLQATLSLEQIYAGIISPS